MDDQFTDRLSDYVDDELDAGERAAVEAHLAACAECRRVVAELRGVVATARALPPRPPARDIWPGIAARTGRTTVRVTFTVPQAVAATLLIAILSGGLVWWLRPRVAVPDQSFVSRVVEEAPGLATPASLGDAAYDAAVTDLQKALAQGRGRLDPATVATIEQSLAAIDRAIDQAREALESDPSNAYLSGHLLETRRRKLDLLRRAAALAMD
jgi:anti-sigma factor RsiW